MMTTRLVIVRHGQTVANTNQLLHGWTDLPLDPVGESQARRVAARLAAEIRPDAILSSPLMRARSTAQAIAEAHALWVHEMVGLKEMNFGDLEGCSLSGLLADYPEIAAQAFDPFNNTLQWPNGDHVGDFHRRSVETFAEIASEHSGRTVVVVSHGGVIGSYLSQLTGHPPNDWQSYNLSNCGISIVESCTNGTTIVARNDCSHLDLAPLPFDESLPR